MLAVAGAGLATALWWRQPPPPPPALSIGTLLLPRREVADFTLIDHRGRSFARADLRGSWSLLFFGYTHCPDVCPTTLATLAAFEKRVRADADPVRPRVLFVSVDARRDTPQQLAGYVPYFDPDFVGLTAADQATVEAFARNLGIAVLLTDRPDGSYNVDHSGAILVIDPAGRMAAVLTGPFTAQALQADFRLIAASGA